MLNRFNHVQLCATPWTVAHQTPLSMVFSRQEYWSGLPCPSPGDLPDPGIEPMSPALAGRFLTTGPPCMPNQTGGGGHLIPGWPVHGMVHVCFRMVSQALRWFQHSELRNTKTKRESGVGSEPGCGGSSCGRRVQGAVLSGQRPEREVPAEVEEKLARPLGGQEMA